jgi:cytochrome c oxidase assembly factor 5
MPRVFPEDATQEDANKRKSGGACANLREDFKLCMLNTECVGVQKRKVKDCFDSNEVPTECVQLRTLLFECKRSILDNRLRFRGKREY